MTFYATVRIGCFPLSVVAVNGESFDDAIYQVGRYLESFDELTDVVAIVRTNK